LAVQLLPVQVDAPDGPVRDCQANLPSRSLAVSTRPVSVRALIDTPDTTSPLRVSISPVDGSSGTREEQGETGRQ
jgi:hypothetical protein